MTFCRILLLTLLCTTLLRAQQSKIDEIRHAKYEEAALRAVEQSISSLQARLRNQDQLANMILGDATAHSKRDASEKILLKDEQASLQIAVQEQLASFASTRPELSKGWVEHVMTSQRGRINKTVESALDAGFPARFAKARDQAVAVQRGNLSLRLRPVGKDLEGIVGPYRPFANLPLDEAQRRALESGSAVIEKYVAAAHVGQVIFEENETYLRKRTTEIFSQEITALWEQLQYILHYTGSGEVERSRIEVAIKNGVSSLPSGHTPFAITKTVIRDRAIELEQNLFREYVKSQLTSPCPAFSPDALLNGATAKPDDLPGTLNEHVAAIAPSARIRTSANLLDNWTLRVPNSSQAALRRRLEQDLKSQAGSEILTAGLENCVRDAIRPVREIAAAEELRAKSPDVADMSKALDDSAINIKLSLASPPDVLQLPLVPDPNLHMEEARKVFQENRRRLLEEAMTAVRKQLFLVREPSRVTNYQSRRVERGGRASQQELQAEYEGEVLEQWNKQRLDLLARVNGNIPNPNKYDGLFSVTRDEISSILKDDHIQVSEQPASDRQSGPGGGGSGTGGGTGNGIGPGVGAGGGGSGSGCGVQNEQKESNQKERIENSQKDWISLLEHIGEVVAALIAVVWAYRRGRKDGVQTASASN